MNFERLTPKQDNDLREQTIDAIKEGTALPVYEGMQDQEIAAAFKERLENMSEEEFNELGEELISSSDEIISQLAEGNGSLSGFVHSVKGNTILLKIGAAGTMLSTVMTGFALSSGNTALGTLNAFTALLVAWQTRSAMKEGRQSVDKIKQISKNTEALVVMMERVQTEKHQDPVADENVKKNHNSLSNDFPSVSLDAGDSDSD